MLTKGYLAKGIIGMSRTMEGKLWAYGHIGAAVIAAYYFCRNNKLDDRTTEAITREVDKMIAQHPALFTPLPDEEADETLLKEIPLHLESSISLLPIQGHNVIFASLAIKALKEVPEAITPMATQGICALLDRLTEKGTDKVLRFSDVTIDCTDISIDDRQDTDIPRYIDHYTLAKFTFDEFLKFKRVYEYTWGQSGHLVTHAQALVELSRLGYSDLARKGYDAHRLHAKMLRRLHDYATDKFQLVRAVKSSPTSASYWEENAGAMEQDTWAFGHYFKYAYHFFDLLNFVDEPLKLKVLDQMAYIMSPSAEATRSSGE